MVQLLTGNAVQTPRLPPSPERPFGDRRDGIAHGHGAGRPAELLGEERGRPRQGKKRGEADGGRALDLAATRHGATLVQTPRQLPLDKGVAVRRRPNRLSEETHGDPSRPLDRPSSSQGSKSRGVQALLQGGAGSVGHPALVEGRDHFFADELWVDVGPAVAHVHVAFQAKDRAAVERFHAAALAAGGRDNGAPGERSYHPGYYAAFALDSDGNNVEAVHHGPYQRSVESVHITW